MKKTVGLLLGCALVVLGMIGLAQAPPQPASEVVITTQPVRPTLTLPPTISEPAVITYPNGSMLYVRLGEGYGIAMDTNGYFIITYKRSFDPGKYPVAISRDRITVIGSTPPPTP